MQNVQLDKLKKGDELLFTTASHDYILTVCWPRERVGILKSTGDKRFRHESVVQYDSLVVQNVGTIFTLQGGHVATPPVHHLEIFGENYSYEVF